MGVLLASRCYPRTSSTSHALNPWPLTLHVLTVPTQSLTQTKETRKDPSNNPSCCLTDGIPGTALGVVWLNWGVSELPLVLQLTFLIWGGLCSVRCRHFPFLLSNYEEKDPHLRFMPTLSPVCVCPQMRPYLVCGVLNFMTNPISSSLPISNCRVQWGSRREIWEENGKINFISYNHRK